jgi:hypothetical protein
LLLLSPQLLLLLSPQLLLLLSPQLLLLLSPQLLLLLSPQLLLLSPHLLLVCPQLVLLQSLRWCSLNLNTNLVSEIKLTFNIGINLVHNVANQNKNVKLFLLPA